MRILLAPLYRQFFSPALRTMYATICDNRTGEIPRGNQCCNCSTQTAECPHMPFRARAWPKASLKLRPMKPGSTGCRHGCRKLGSSLEARSTLGIPVSYIPWMYSSLSKLAIFWSAGVLHTMDMYAISKLPMRLTDFQPLTKRMIALHKMEPLAVSLCRNFAASMGGDSSNTGT